MRRTLIIGTALICIIVIAVLGLSILAIKAEEKRKTMHAICTVICLEMLPIVYFISNNRSEFKMLLALIVAVYIFLILGINVLGRLKKSNNS